MVCRLVWLFINGDPVKNRVAIEIAGGTKMVLAIGSIKELLKESPLLHAILVGLVGQTLVHV